MLQYNFVKSNLNCTDPSGSSYDLKYKQGIPTADIDGDGTVRLADALAALRHVAGTELINSVTQETKFFNGDVGGLIKGRVLVMSNGMPRGGVAMKSYTTPFWEYGRNQYSTPLQSAQAVMAAGLP